MYSYAKKNKKELIDALKKHGYQNDDIESAFINIYKWSALENQAGKSKRSQNTLNHLVAIKNVYTYVLKETLRELIKDLEIGRKVRILKDNLQIYKEVCENYLEKCIELIESKN